MLEILHNPKGQQHPYEQGAEERFPREPLAGEKFTIGIVTRPPGAAKSVKVYTHPPAVAVDALLQADWQAKLEEGVGAEFLDRLVRVEQDVWHAELTAPPVGKKLHYWIESEGQRTADFILHGETWQISVLPDNRIRQIFNGGKPAASLEKIEWLTDGSRARRVRLTFTATPDEAFYGLGERYNALNQRGEILDVRCYEQYKNQGKRTYMPIPFLLSSRNYGLFVNSSRWMQFDLTASDTWTLEADFEEFLELVWFTGDNSFEISGQFTLCTGQPALPPLWAFGLWVSGNEWNSQEKVQREVALAKQHAIYPSVLVIEAWSDETTFYIWNDAQYQAVPGSQSFKAADFQFSGKWPDPQGMIDSLHESGIRLILWQIPVLKKQEGDHPQHAADHAYFEQQKFGVRQPDGSLYKVRPFWFRDGYLLDVTHPEAARWWMEKRAYLLEMGIDGFKTDGGEHLWGADTLFADGRRGDELWNLYPKLYTELYYQFAVQKKQGDALTFSRAGFTGSQTSPVHWAGDENSTWEAFQHSILAGLSAGLSGILFWGWDLAGFSGEIPSAELYLRSAAMAAFCPIMQYHSEYNQHREPSHDRTPWNIQQRTGDERVIPTFRYFVNVRHALMPYIWQEARFAAQSGQPMMRALQVMDSQASPYQYFFGRDLLISPVVEEGATTWPVYLPQGEWCDFWTGRHYPGGKTHQVAVPLDTIPVFVRAGAEIPMAASQIGAFVPLTPDPVYAKRFS